jgi:hypothetical protein
MADKAPGPHDDKNKLADAEKKYTEIRIKINKAIEDEMKGNDIIPKKAYSILRQEYIKARNEYTDILKKLILGVNKNIDDYLTKRIDILNFESEKIDIDYTKEKNEDGISHIFNSYKGLASRGGKETKEFSKLIQLYPFQTTEQELKEQKTEANVYDLFVKFPADRKNSKEGVYETILANFEAKEGGTLKDSAVCLSPFALYKLWKEDEPKSFPLLLQLLDFLPAEDITELKKKLVSQFDTFDTTYREAIQVWEADKDAEYATELKPVTVASSAAKGPSRGTRLKTGTPVMGRLIQGGLTKQKIEKGTVKPTSTLQRAGRRHITPRLKREGRNTKKRSK